MKKLITSWLVIFSAILFSFSAIAIAGETSEENASAIILKGANCLDSEANWTDKTGGREAYNALQNMPSQTVVNALAKAVIKGKDRLRILFLAVKLGIKGTEERLSDILAKHGNKSMAEDFLNSGSSELFEGGKRWANANGYSINTGMGSHRVRWGSF